MQHYLVFGNAYLEKRTNWLGDILSQEPSLAKYTRSGVDLDTYWLVQYDMTALLNESATLFRRKYYINGSHVEVHHIHNRRRTEPGGREQHPPSHESAEGPGNFHNLFIYKPNGKNDGIQIIPLSEVVAKDEFLNIKILAGMT